jgi:1,4-alpha-glucan branching enzyme
MSDSSNDPIIERGMALHKMIRFITMSIGGEGYLNFMGNEFGHPEWIDFPREGNGWSYFYCRRQWHLADDNNLKYQYLQAFDKSMIDLVKKYKLFGKKIKHLFIDDQRKVITYQRGSVVFAVNFHPFNSYDGYYLTLPREGKYKVILSTDSEQFGGHNRISTEYIYSTEKRRNEKPKFQIYIPARTAVCLIKLQE